MSVNLFPNTSNQSFLPLNHLPPAALPEPSPPEAAAAAAAAEPMALVPRSAAESAAAAAAAVVPVFSNPSTALIRSPAAAAAAAVGSSHLAIVPVVSDSDANNICKRGLSAPYDTVEDFLIGLRYLNPRNMNVKEIARWLLMQFCWFKDSSPEARGLNPETKFEIRKRLDVLESRIYFHLDSEDFLHLISALKWSGNVALKRLPLRLVLEIIKFLDVTRPQERTASNAMVRFRLGNDKIKQLATIINVCKLPLISFPRLTPDEIKALAPLLTYLDLTGWPVDSSKVAAFLEPFCNVTTFIWKNPGDYLIERLVSTSYNLPHNLDTIMPKLENLVFHCGFCTSLPLTLPSLKKLTVRQVIRLPNIDHLDVLKIYGDSIRCSALDLKSVGTLHVEGVVTFNSSLVVREHLFVYEIGRHMLEIDTSQLKTLECNWGNSSPLVEKGIDLSKLETLKCNNQWSGPLPSEMKSIKLIDLRKCRLVTDPLANSGNFSLPPDLRPGVVIDLRGAIFIDFTLPDTLPEGTCVWSDRKEYQRGPQPDEEKKDIYLPPSGAAPGP